MTIRTHIIRWLGAAALAVPFVVPPGVQAQPAPKVLRIMFNVAETGFDPARVSDRYSRVAIDHMFDSLYAYDHLARPFKVIPNTAAALPEVSEDFRTWTIRLKPGTYFADDAAFKGVKRELVAEDYVYSIKRFFDPAVKSPRYTEVSREGFVGMEALREAAIKTKKPFNYDQQVPGLRALDRYTLQIKLNTSRPRLVDLLSDMFAVSREVIEAYGERSMEHPVGTGPFRLAEWRRSSQMVFERNPNFREVRYDAQPAADDAEGQAILARLKGRRLPLVDRVEVSVIEEGQPRWLAFLNDEFDIVEVPLDFGSVAAPKGKLAPNLEKRGIRMHQVLASDVVLVYFNMNDPMVGGYTAQRVALRRAISLATDRAKDIRLVRRGLAIPAQSMIAPGTYGYDPEFKSESSDYNLARARALLDLNGYVDRDGDGWRDQPDGSPLVLESATQPDQVSRQMDELWRKNMDALGVRVNFKVARWPEQLKQARAGKLMMWMVGWSATIPDGQDNLQLAAGSAIEAGQNYARFNLPAYDAVFDRIDALPNGPERLAAFAEAKRIIAAYVPYMPLVHRVLLDLTQPRVIGYRRPLFWRNTWHMLDVETPAPAAQAP